MADIKYKVSVDTKAAQANINGLRSALSGLAAAFGVREVVKFADTITNLRNRLRTLTSDAQAVDRQFTAIANIARDSRAPLEQTGELFFRIARAADQLGISERETAEITDTLAKALVSSGISAQEAAGPLLQLGQALQSGRFQGDELRSILEGMPIVATALANELQVPIGALRDLGKQGKLTSDVFVRAMKNSREAVVDAFGRTAPTIGQSFENIRTEVLRFFDVLEQNTGIFASFATNIGKLADSIQANSGNLDSIAQSLRDLTRVLLPAIIAFVALGKGMRVLKQAGDAIAGMKVLKVGFWASFLNVLKGIPAAFGAMGKNILRMAGVLKSSFSSLQSFLFAVVALGKALLRFTGIVGIILAVAEAINYVVKQVTGVDLLAKAWDYLGKAAGWVLEQFKKLGEFLGIYTREQEAATEATEDHLAGLNEEAPVLEQKVANIDEITRALRDMATEYQVATKATLDQFAADTKALNMTAEQIMLQEELQNLQENFLSSYNQLLDEFNQKKEEGFENTVSETAALQELQQRLDEISLAYMEATGEMTNLVAARSKNLELQALENYRLEQAQKFTDELNAAQNELAKMGMTEIEKKYYDIEQAANAAALAAIRAEEARRGEPLAAEEIAEYYRIAKEGADALKQTNQEIYEQSISIGQGFKDAFETIQKQFTPYQMAQDAILGTWNKIGSAIDQFVETGKFSFKDFARSVIADLAKMIAKAMIFRAISGIAGAFGLSLPGLANGGPAKQNQPYIVGEKGPELFVPRTSGTVVPNNKLAGMEGTGQVNAPVTNNYITNNINAVDAKSVAQLFAENRKTLLGAVATAQREMPYMA